MTVASGRWARTCSAPCTSISRRTSAPSGGSRDGRAHQVAQELGPLEEAAGRDGVLERGAVDEVVGIALAFARTRLAGGPTPAQPERGIGGDELGRQRALAGPTGADEHEDQWLSAQSL